MAHATTPVPTRQVGGTMLDSFTMDVPAARVEIIKRSARGRLDWHFSQPAPTLFWYQQGWQSYCLNVDGTVVESAISPRSNLTYYPPGASIRGSFGTDGATSKYAAVFFDPEFARDLQLTLPIQPLVGFSHRGISAGLEELFQETDSPSSNRTEFAVLAQGWALQAMVHLSRLGGQPRPQSLLGFDDATARVLDDYIRLHLDEQISLADLARASGYSERHISRHFSTSFGMTPLRYVQHVRVETARHMLEHTTLQLSAVAQRCGFAQLQHFSSAFRAATGQSPSTYRCSRQR